VVTVGVLILLACAGAICGGWVLPELRTAGLAAAALLIGVAAWVIWWGLLFFQVVRIDPLLRSLNVYRLDALGRFLVFVAPPLLIAAAFVAGALLRSRR